MVQSLHLGVVSQQVQALAVGLPQEFHPWSEQQAISTILSVLSTHSAQEHTGVTTGSTSIYTRTHTHKKQAHADHLISALEKIHFCVHLCPSPLWSLDVVQILDVQDHLLGLPLSSLSLLLGQLQVSPDHILQRFDVHLTAKIEITL